MSMDGRFTTVCADMYALLDTVDVDSVDDIATVLMSLFHRPVGVQHLEDDDGEGAIEVVLGGDQGDVEVICHFPVSLTDLVLLCAEIDDRLGPYTRTGNSPPRASNPLSTMTDGELNAAMTDAMGKMRIFNLMNEE